MVKQPVPAPTVKRKAPVKDTPPSERSRPSKKLKPNNVADTASTFSTASKPKRPVPKNAVAGPSTQKEPPLSVSSTRSSSRVSKPTTKKVAAVAHISKKKTVTPRVLVEDPDSDSDGLPLGILSSSLKRTPSTSPNKPEGTPKRKVVHLGAIELSSGSEDDARARPPRKRVKTSNKSSASSEVIDLCSDDGEQPKKVTPAKRRQQKNSTPASNSTKKATSQNEVLTTEKETPKKGTSKNDPPKTTSSQKKNTISKNVASTQKDEVVVILSTDDEAESSADRIRDLPVTKKATSNTLQAMDPVIHDTLGTYKSPADAGVEELLAPALEPPPVADPLEPVAFIPSSPPIASPSNSKVDDAAGSEDVSLDSLQASYKEAMEGRASIPSNPIQRRNSAFTSVKFSPPARIITFSDVPSIPTLHTPIYFSRSLSSLSDSILSKRPARTTPALDSLVMVDALDASESVEVQSNPVSNFQAPSSSDSEKSALLSAGPVETVKELLRSPSTKPQDPLPEDSNDPPATNEPPIAVVEQVHSEAPSSGEPVSYDLPLQANSAMDEVNVYKAQPEDREETGTEELPPLDPTTRLSPDILLSDLNNSLPDESCDTTISAVSHDDACLSFRPPSRDGNTPLEVATPMAVNSSVLYTPALYSETLSVSEENIPTSKPVPGQDGDLRSSITEEILQKAILVMSTLQDMIVSRRAGQLFPQGSESSSTPAENMSTPAETMSSPPAPSAEETVSSAICGQDSATDVPQPAEPDSPAVEDSAPLPVEDPQSSITLETNQESVSDNSLPVKLPIVVLETESSPAEGPQDIASPPEPPQDTIEGNTSIGLSSLVFGKGPSMSDDQQGPVLVDIGEDPVGGNNLPTEEPSTTRESEASLYAEHQAPILLDASQSLSVEKNILDDPLLILTDLDSESSLSNAQGVTSCVSVEKEGSLFVDAFSLGGADDPDDEILLTALDDIASANTVTLPTPVTLSAKSQTTDVITGASSPPYNPLEEAPLPDTDTHALAHMPLESVITQILIGQGRTFPAADDTPSDLPPITTGQELSPLEEPEAPIYVEPIQTDNNSAAEPSCSTCEKEPLPSEPQNASCQPAVSPIPEPLDDSAKPSAIPLPLCAVPIPGVETSPVRSLSSSFESLSPATPVQQSEPEPLIWTEPPKPSRIGLPICDIDMSQISISWLMSSSKVDEVDEDDDVSGLEFMYPEELC